MTKTAKSDSQEISKALELVQKKAYWQSDYSERYISDH